MMTVIGLGNPGSEYKKTRHNAGFLVLQILAEKYNFSEWKYQKKIDAEVAEGLLVDYPFIFILPQTFMNNSGKTISVLMKEKLTATDMVVVYDDVDIPFGKIKLSYGRGTGGHNGLDSVISHTGTRDFLRVRVGIAPVNSGEIMTPSGEERANFVLKKFRPEEFEQLPITANLVGEVLVSVMKNGMEKAMAAANT